jgi:hypothetical protein
MMYANPDADFDANKPEVKKPDASAPEVEPPPAPGDGSKLVLGGSVTLIGSGADSCTNQTPAPGDRWCGFTKPSSNLGFDELWVINVTAAAAGTPIKCDTSDPNCLRLTSGLFSEQNSDGSPSFRIHGFDGDTLIYYAELGPTARTSFIGPVWGWRPGWPRGHKLTSDTGVVCNGHPKKAVAVCFEGADVATTQGSLFFELHAGPIAPTDTKPLPLVDKVLTAVDTDDQNLQKFQVDLSDDAEWVAYSARLVAGGREVLKAKRLSDASAPVTIATDVSRFNISPDLKKWYWLKKFNYDLNGAESGTLEMANFPAGDGVGTLAEGVADYSNAGDKGLLVRSGAAQFVGQLDLMADRDAPQTLKTFDKNVLGVVAQSDDGQKALYVKDITIEGLVDLFLNSTTRTQPCTLAGTKIGLPAGDFITKGEILTWARINDLNGTIEGLYTTASDCASRKFSTNIGGWQPVSDEGLVYEDEFNQDGLDEATLRQNKVTNMALQSSGTVLQKRAASPYAPLLPTLNAVVYTIATHTSADGLYVNTKLSFTTTPVVPPPDGGPEAGSPPVDGGGSDVAVTEAGGGDVPSEAGASEAGASEAGASEAGASEAGGNDAGAPDVAVDAPDPDAASGN